MNVAMLGKPVALAAQFLQFLRAQGVTQQFIGIARRVEAGADMGLQHPRTDAVFPQYFVKLFMAAPSSDTSRRISAWAPAFRACCINRVTASSAALRSSSGVQSVP